MDEFSKVIKTTPDDIIYATPKMAEGKVEYFTKLAEELAECEAHWHLEHRMRADALVRSAKSGELNHPVTLESDVVNYVNKTIEIYAVQKEIFNNSMNFLDQDMSSLLENIPLGNREPAKKIIYGTANAIEFFLKYDMFSTSAALELTMCKKRKESQLDGYA